MDLSHVPVPILIAITTVFGVLNYNLKSYYVKTRMTRESEQYSFNALSCIFSAFALWALNGFTFGASVFSVLLGVAFGVIVMAHAIWNGKAVQEGPFGYTTVIVNMSTAITALSGALFWGESLTPLKLVGIALMLVCCAFAVDTTGDSGKKGGIKWFLLCILALIASAGIGLMQKVHQTSEYKSELMGFLIISFCTGAVISALAYLLLHRKETALCGKPERKLLLPIVALVATCGIGVAINHSFNLFLSGAMDTSIFFPVINGLPLLASLIVSFVIFKEKLKKKQLFGFAIGIAALVCLFI